MRYIQTVLDAAMPVEESLKSNIVPIAIVAIVVIVVLTVVFLKINKKKSDKK